MFDFGENWRAYLAGTDVAANAARMEEGLRAFLGVGSVAGKVFLDVGSGSGLASLAALRMGAARVVSVDVSAASVACAESLRAREGAPETAWTVARGSILDDAFVASLPRADVVYAWGVLHHTGDMRGAFRHAAGRVAPGGLFHVAIYNRVRSSPAWRVVKRVYNGRGPAARAAMHNAWFVYNAAARAAGLRHPFRRERGMSVYYDAVDWLGGYPYEYATYDEVVELVRAEGAFEVVRGKRDRGFGCNELLFRRAAG